MLKKCGLLLLFPEMIGSFIFLLRKKAVTLIEIDKLL